MEKMNLEEDIESDPEDWSKKSLITMSKMQKKNSELQERKI